MPLSCSFHLTRHILLPCGDSCTHIPKFQRLLLQLAVLIACWLSGLFCFVYRSSIALVSFQACNASLVGIEQQFQHGSHYDVQQGYIMQIRTGLA